MAHKNIDRCKETTSTTGTGTLTLTGAVAGFVTVANATNGLTVDGDTGWFEAINGTEWEVFLGTRVDATHLARTAVISSSNSGAAVSFTAAPTVFSTVPGSKLSTVGPSFSAGKNATQSVPATTATKVAFQSEEFDTGNCFDSTTNYRFQPNVAGYYQVSGRVGVTTVFTTNSLVSIYKNGSNYAAGVQPNAQGYGMTVGALIYLNGTTDYVELYVYLSAALTLAGNSQENYFTAHLAALPGAPMLAPIVAPGPSFAAYRSTDQTGVTNATYVKVAFNAEEFDTGNCFDSTTNNRFQPNVEGYYQVSWHVTCDGTTLTAGHSQLYKNGSAVCNGSWGSASSSVATSVGSTTIYMNGTTDYLEVYGYAAAASGNKFRLGAAFTRFSASLAALPQVPQPTTGPAFCAYRSTDQTGLTNSTYVKAQFNAESFDTDGCFDSTTNYRFTPGVAGYYAVEWSTTLAGTTLTAGAAVLYKNGAAECSGSWGAPSSAVSVCAGAATVYMNGTTDYLEVFIYTTAASGNKMALGLSASRFSGHFVRGE